jgi:hypothetical protein
MKRRELERLLLSRALSPEEFEQKIVQASRVKDAAFLRAVTQAFSLKKKKCQPLALRVQIAYEELYSLNPGRRVTKKMIREYVDPKIARRHYARAFKDAKLSWLPKGNDVPKKLF